MPRAASTPDSLAAPRRRAGTILDTRGNGWHPLPNQEGEQAAAEQAKEEHEEGREEECEEECRS